jgi:predicted transposase YdaD
MVLDQDEETLNQSNNIFAIIVLTVLINLKRKAKQENSLVKLYLEIVKNLINKGYPLQKVRSVMNFLRYYARFNKENSIIFEKEIQHITGKTKTMGIEQYLLERATTKGFKKGIEKAHKKAILNGHDKGLSIAMICNINELSEEYVMKVLRDNNRID